MVFISELHNHCLLSLRVDGKMSESIWFLVLLRYLLYLLGHRYDLSNSYLEDVMLMSSNHFINHIYSVDDGQEEKSGSQWQ